MARTIEEIQETMQKEWMQSVALQKLYGFELGEPFNVYFSKASIETLLLYIVAYCAYTLEVLFDKVKEEIEYRIDQQVPGRTKWYARKLKEYLDNFDIDEWGNPVTEGKTEAEILSAQIIKHAVAIDEQTSGRLLLKIATEDGGGKKCPITDTDTVKRIEGYILKIKYAGVRTKLINAEGDSLDLKANVYYDAVKVKNTVENDCMAAIDKYIQNLPFNGVFTPMELTDCLQTVPGVCLIQLSEVRRRGKDGTETIKDKCTPYAGYFYLGNIKLNMIMYHQPV